MPGKHWLMEKFVKVSRSRRLFGLALGKFCGTTRALLKIDYEGTRWDGEEFHQITVPLYLNGQSEWNLRTTDGNTVHLHEDGTRDDNPPVLR